MSSDTLTVTDNRTGRQYTLPIEHGAIRATDLTAIRTGPDQPGLISYDPGLTATAACRSQISRIDGERGTLRFRGYPIEQLAEHSTFLETAYLIVKGELPTASHFAMWRRNIAKHTLTHENVKRFIQGFRYDAEPMGILIATLGALSTFYPDARDIMSVESRRVQTRRLIGKMPTIAAFAYRHSHGLPIVYPDNELSYVGNFLSMLFRMTELRYAPNPVLERALDVLFILHADDEQNCSSTTMRLVGSALSDPYSAVAAACAALGGPRHGAANVGVIQMLQEIGSPAGIPAFLKQVKAGNRPMPGFGHRIYRHLDPRAKIISRLAPQVFAVKPGDAVLETALALEKIAREDDELIAWDLFPNLDFYSGTIYYAMDIPLGMFPVMLAIARTAGWMAQWAEMLLDVDQQRIVRPRQLYVGLDERAYVPLAERQDGGALETEVRGPL
jgi:citrate synthase